MKNSNNHKKSASRVLAAMAVAAAGVVSPIVSGSASAAREYDITYCSGSTDGSGNQGYCLDETTDNNHRKARGVSDVKSGTGPFAETLVNGIIGSNKFGNTSIHGTNLTYEDPYIDFVSNGYVFAGWALNGNTTSLHQPGKLFSDIKANSNFTLVAVWVPVYLNDSRVTTNTTFNITEGNTTVGRARVHQTQTVNGTDVNIEITEVEDYFLSSFTAVADSANLTTPNRLTYHASNVESSINATVTFLRWNYPFTVDTDEHVTITPAEGNITYMGSQTFHADIEEGYHLSMLYLDDGIAPQPIDILSTVDRDGNFTISDVAEDTLIYARTEADQYVVTKGNEQEVDFSPKENPEEGLDTYTDFIFDGPFALLDSVMVDNTTLEDGVDYYGESGSTILHIANEFLFGLGNGEHLLVVSYLNDTEAYATFTITGIPESPETGIFSFIGASSTASTIFDLVAVMTLAGATYYFVAKKATRK